MGGKNKTSMLSNKHESSLAPKPAIYPTVIIRCAANTKVL